MRLARFAPVMAANARQKKKLRRAYEDLTDAQVRICNLELELAVRTRRGEQWRRRALELASKVSPRAMAVCLFAVQSEEIEDLDEVPTK